MKKAKGLNLESNINNDVFSRIRRERIVATVVIDDIDSALPLAQAMCEGGLSCIELTLRTECALKAIELIADKMPQALIGAGTVLTAVQAAQVKDAGAMFAVAPGLNPVVVEEAMRLALPFSPGVCTPSDIEKALCCGCKCLKFFPAEPLGGINYLKCMAAPYMHTGIGFIPLGGIGADNFVSYLKHKFIIAVGGSWLTTREMIAAKDWDGIKKLCADAKSRLSQI